MGLTVYGGGGKPEEEKTVTAGTSAIVVNPSSGKVMKKVTVNPTPTESKSVTPTTSELTVTPSEGKHLSQVVVGAVEDVTPEVTAQTPVITQIAENLGVTITTPSGTNKQILQGNNANLLNINNNAKKEGAYVWKKYTYIPEEVISLSSVTITATRPSNTTMSFTSDDVDLSKLTADTYIEFFNGLSFGTTIANSISFSAPKGSLLFGYGGDTTGYTVSSWDSVNKRLVFVTNINQSYGNGNNTTTTGTRVLAKAGIGDFLDYIVSDSPTAYPDGAVHTDGYWYEKVVEGVAGVDFGEVTLASSATSVTVNHRLGVVPSWVALIPKEFVLGATYAHLNINGENGVGSASIKPVSGKNVLSTTEITFATNGSSNYKSTGYYWIAIA